MKSFQGSLKKPVSLMKSRFHNLKQNLKWFQQGGYFLKSFHGLKRFEIDVQSPDIGDRFGAFLKSRSRSKAAIWIWDEKSGFKLSPKI
jgi:hypothetical protein